MKKAMKIIMVAAALAAGSAYALPDIDDVTGALSKSEIETALEPAGKWFDQTDAYCHGHDYSTCEVRLEISVKGAGGAPGCKMAYTTIKTEASERLYCQVANTLVFPAKGQDSAFSLLFNIEARQADKPSAAPAVVAVNNTPPSIRGLLSSRASANRRVAGCVDQAGVRSLESINACFDDNMGNLYWPFQHALARNPDMQGIIRVKLNIGKDGHVTSATADSVDGALDGQFVDAVVKAVNDMDFHKAADDTTITHGFNFN